MGRVVGDAAGCRSGFGDGVGWAMFGMADMGQIPGKQGAVTIDEAAKRLGISLGTLQTIVEHGFLKSFRDADGNWKVLLEPGEGLQHSPPPHGRRVPPAAVAAIAAAAASAPNASPAAGELPRHNLASTAPSDTALSDASSPDAAFVEPPLQASPSSAAMVGDTDAALAPDPLVAQTVERLLHEQVGYLRGQIERRDADLARKDQLIGELAGKLAKLGRRGLERPAAPSDLRAELDRVRQEQTDITGRHQRAIDSLGDLLLSLRNHLANQSGNGGSRARA